MGKSFAETNNQTPFDWNKALQQDPAEISEAQLAELNALSKSWVTCACGNQCHIIPRGEAGAPEDDLLNGLGRSFYNVIHHVYYAKNFDSTEEEINDMRQGFARARDTCKNRSSVC
jgi:hypothetical protein